MTDAVQGYAVVDSGGINVRTVCPSKIGAMVNWLIVEKSIGTVAATSNSQIREMFEKHKGDAVLMPVTIQVTQ